MEQTAKREYITPELAAEYLALNTKNYRKMKTPEAMKYARDMKNGRWEDNGMPIVFHRDGYLADGQNRLNAIILSGTPQWMWVLRGVDSILFDVHNKRTSADHIRAKFGANTNNTISGAISLIAGAEANSKRASDNEKLDCYDHNHEDIELAWNLVCAGAKNGCLRKSGCMVAIYCALKKDLLSIDGLENFCRICNSGFPIEGVVNEPPLALRKTLIEGQALRQDGTKVSAGGAYVTYCVEVTWKALLAFKRGLRGRNMYRGDGTAMQIIKNAQEAQP